jgi:septal ring factor EnvC (AmiA/AmiB activator)
MRRGVLITAALLFSLAALAAGAAPPGAQVAALRGELEAKGAARDDARAQAQQLREDIARLDAQLTELKAVAASGQPGLADKRARLAALTQQETALRAQMGANQGALAALLGALELYRRDPPPALLVSPGSARDAVRAAILVRAMEPELAARAAAFRVKADELQRVRRGITGLSEDLFTSESALADGRAQIEQSIREKTALERQMDADAADAERRAESLTSALKAAGVSPQALARIEAGPAGPPSAFAPPAAGVLIRRFGQASPGGQTSDGLTWRTGAGAQVRAPAGGIVEYSGQLKNWGGVLILNVGGGYQIVLTGLDKIAAAAGRPVQAGQTLGAMPQAGGAPELYLEVRKDGAPANPERWFRARSGAAASGRG